jgi:plastocyanin
MRAAARLATLAVPILLVAAVMLTGAGCKSSPGTHSEPLVTPRSIPVKTPPGATVKPSASASIAPSPQAAAGANTIVMKDNVFEPKDLQAKAGQPFTVMLVNSGLFLHNMRIASAEGNYDASEVISDPQFIEQGKTGSLAWTPPATGTYRFRCDIHADIMSGTITVD